MAGAVATVLLFVHRRLGAVAVVVALVMAFARVYVAAHWPRDVIAGLLLGALVAVIGQLALVRPLAWFVAWAPTTRLRPLFTTARPRPMMPI